MPVVALLAVTLLASGFPEAEDPLPDRVGPDVSFTLAGFGGALAGIVFISSPPSRRETAIRWGGVVGFVAGAALYLVALAVQIASRQ